MQAAKNGAPGVSKDGNAARLLGKAATSQAQAVTDVAQAPSEVRNTWSEPTLGRSEQEHAIIDSPRRDGRARRGACHRVQQCFMETVR